MDITNKSLAFFHTTIARLFPHAVPTRARWTDPADIVAVLELVASQRNLNHTFLPDGGGLDLDGAELFAGEAGCITLYLGGRPSKTRRSIDICRPSGLYFERVGPADELSYFRLECAGLEPTGLDQPQAGRAYDLVVDRLSEPGTYIAGWAEWNTHVNTSGEEDPLPEDARLVQRYHRGAFVIFAKGSVYNEPRTEALDAYNGRHNDMNANAFRAHVEAMWQALQDDRP